MIEDPQQLAHLTFIFPPQTITEQAHFEAALIPNIGNPIQPGGQSSRPDLDADGTVDEPTVRAVRPKMSSCQTAPRAGDGTLPRPRQGELRLTPGFCAAELGREAGADLLAVLVAPLADLAVEPLAVVAPFVPALEEVRHVGVEDAGLSPVRRARGRLLEILVAVDGPRAYAQLAADVPEVRAGQVQSADVLPLPDQALVASPCGLLDLSVVVSRAVGHDGPGTEGPVAPVLGLGPRHRRLAEGGLLLEQEVLEHLREVVQQVPAVRHLHRVRGALRQCFAVDVRGVAGGELHPGVPPQPGHEASLRAFGQQIHHLAPFEVPIELWYTTLALLAAFTPVNRLNGGEELGNFLLHLFFAVLGRARSSRR
jgi:hypothetical protein